MKNKTLILYALHIPLIALLVVLGVAGLIAFNKTETGSVEPGKQVRIEEGTTYTDTFTKDGKTIMVTKTYRLDGVYITTKTYSSSGELLGEKNRVNPLKDHVVVYPSTTSTPPVDTTPIVSDPEPPVVEPEKIVGDKTPTTPPIEKDFEEMEDELVSEIQDLTLLTEEVDEEPVNIIQRVVNVIRNFFRKFF